MTATSSTGRPDAPNLDRPGAARRLLRRAAAPDSLGVISHIDPLGRLGLHRPDRVPAGARPGDHAQRRRPGAPRPRPRGLRLAAGRGPRPRPRGLPHQRVRRPALPGDPARARAARSSIVAETDALVVRRRSAPAARSGEPPLVPPEDVLVETRGCGQHRAPDPPPAAAGGRGRPPDRVRGVHARRQLVQLSAAQARHREPARRGPPGGATTSTGSPGRRGSPSHRVYTAGPLASTRP